ncbi:MAG: MFS transporter, partial [Desulfomonilaceae bacterium]
IHQNRCPTQGQNAIKYHNISTLLECWSLKIGVGHVKSDRLLGSLVDRMDRDKLILFCLIGFGTLLVATSQIQALWQTVFLGGLFGVTQGISYPAMMARMVDRSTDINRAIVVSLFTGSFGVGINLSVLLWGFIANFQSLSFMFVFGGCLMLLAAFFCVLMFALNRSPSAPTQGIVHHK